MIEEPTYFDNKKGQRLVGMRHIPKGKGPYPTVILYHGLSGSKEEGYARYVRLSRLLCLNGYQVYRFDYRGHGDSEGDFDDLVMDDLVKDSGDILEYVCKNKETDRRHMAIVSRSMCPGLYLRLTSENIRAMVMHCPAVDPRVTLEHGWGVGLRYARKGERGGYNLNPDFWDNLGKYNAFTAIKYADMPILIVTGDEDEVIWVDDVREFYKAANKPKKLVVVKYTGHDFERREHEDRVHRETLAWIKKYV